MARLGAKDDSKRLRDLLQGVSDKAAKLQGRSLQRWTTETHVRAEENAIHVDLHDLDKELTDELVSIVLGQSDELWSRRIRFICGTSDETLDGEEIRPNLLSSLNRFTRDDGKDWRVSNRDGRPYIDLKKSDPDPQDPPTFETGRLRLPRKRSVRSPASIPELAPREERISQAPIAVEGRDRQADIGGLVLVVALAIPLLGAYYAVLVAAIDAMGMLQGTLAAVLLIVVYGLLQVGVVMLARQLTRPKRIHRCRNCDTVNRILPILRRANLQCAHCENPLYGAWPIQEIEGVVCAKCNTLNKVPGDKITQGIPACSKCESELMVNAVWRRS